MYNAIMSLSYIGSLLYMAMNDYQELLSSYVAQNNELQVQGPNISIWGPSSVELQEPYWLKIIYRQWCNSDIMNIHVLIIRIEILKFEAWECDEHETDASHG